MKPLMLRGQPACAGFRLASLLENVKRASPGLGATAVEAVYVYFLDRSVEDLAPDVLAKACTLLEAQADFAADDGFLVTPRKGTISPWSSKATDIFHNCGLKDIRRVERGIHYRIVVGSPSDAGRVSSRNRQRQRDASPRARGKLLGPEELGPALQVLHDRMTEGVYRDVSDIFEHLTPPPFKTFDVLGRGREELARANVEMGLALSDDEVDYLCRAYTAIQRNPTDVELVMFGQVNSEHCRHKIFNAEWIIDGQRQERSLFDMIRTTHEKHPQGTLVAYRDNAAVVEGFEAEWFEVRRDGSRIYQYTPGRTDLIMKVETHNHPTAISPYPGAATGAGGEIRDETATGSGGKSKAGLSAFMVSNLLVPDFHMPWEKDCADFPSRLATPLQIMIEGPIGGARFGNEFGRPQLLGLFRTFEQEHNGRYRGYHKPIMAAGGMGNIKREHVLKQPIPPGALILQIGGPAMKIGLGGGAASSMATGSNIAELDFDSVQRDNAEMERRCQEVVDACIALGPANPILSIHDIGAGGLSNGCPELVSETGGRFWLRKIPNEDASMSPMEIWCCEAQERYVLAIAPASLPVFLELCERERCPVAVIGEATGDHHLSLDDERFNNKPIDVDLGVILGKPPRKVRAVQVLRESHAPFEPVGIRIDDAVERVLRLPAVASKTFLITIADRSVTGLVARDQMVGPYQTPIADVAVTATSYTACTGEAMAMGERTPIALISGPASGRMAVGEALTNLMAANIGELGNVKLSANWMCACGEEGEDHALYETVRAVSMELCPALGISIPVGKDSVSMRTLWKASDGQARKVSSPLSLLVSAFSPVKDVRKTVTPDLKAGESALILIDLAAGKNRLGGSALAQVYNQVGSECPDLDDPGLFVSAFRAIQEMVEEGLLLAYHDRSDGGLFTTLAEMAFGGRRGVRVDVDDLGQDPLAVLFAEELGAVLQVAKVDLPIVRSILDRHGVRRVSYEIGVPRNDKRIVIRRGGEELYSGKTVALLRAWSELTYRMQARRDNPVCAQEEYDGLLDEGDPGLNFRVTYSPEQSFTTGGRRPRMAVLREQGINGQVEMAAAFDRAGFECVDLHMTDLLAERANLDGFAGLVACGGFSYGDVLGAGSGWAKSILFNKGLKDMFRKFFEREDTFALGVCNGCQMFSQLKDIIPGADDWPAFGRNKCEQFEARYVTVEILPSPSIFFTGMAGSRLGIPVAHGEGRADFDKTGSLQNAQAGSLVTARFVDNYGKPATRYPLNPNGSPDGVTGLTTHDGRVTILMPHPERAFRSVQMSWRPADQFRREEGPWLEMFRNARRFVG